MDDLGDLDDICDIKPFDEIYISTDDDEPIPQITDVFSLKNDALPEASKSKYYRIYHEFKNWQKKKNVTTISEPLLLEYFQDLSVKQKPTSLWAHYSMLKRTLQVNLGIDIKSYNQVLAFLKEKSSGYEPVKSKSFTLEEVVKFVVEAPDDLWLDIKTVCIFAVCGSLKNGELRSIKYCDVELHGDLLLVKVEDSCTKSYRSFTITGQFCNVVKKYVALRPAHAPIERFFLNYQRERCTIQPIGKNKFARMPYKMAQYLKLPEPVRYTGQAFRLSGQIILKNTSQTIDRRRIEAIARNYSSCSNTSQSVNRSEDDTKETVIKIEEDESDSDDDLSIENLLKVDNLRLHCTVCDTHVGCAVANEGNIRTHPVLLVTQCQTCHTFYNRREFTVGANSKELQCRWCAQGSGVYSCSKCPYVFCRKCILQNLSKNVITEIEKNNNWRCFACAPGVLSHLKAQHWALTNHLRQTKNQIRVMKNPDQLYELMYQDLTLCCGKDPLNSRQNPKDKRRRTATNTNYNSSAPDPKRIRNHSVVGTPSQSPTLPTIVSQKSVSPPPLILRQNPSSSTEPPPLTLRPMHSLLSERSASPAEVIDLPSVQMAPIPNSQLPAMAQFTELTSSGYQTYNILVDMAARDDTFVRLPNGKLIQVRPQSVATQPTQQRREILQQMPSVPIQNSSSQAVTHQAPSAQMINRPSLQIINVGQSPQQQNRQPNLAQQPLPQQKPLQQQTVPQPLQIINVGQQPLQQQRQQTLNKQQTFQPPLQIIDIGQPLRNQQTFQPPRQIIDVGQPLQQSSSQPQQQPVPSQQPLQRPYIQQQQQQQPNGVSNTRTTPQPPASKSYPNTPFGQAQTVLEKEVHGAQEICQQIVGKCNALMKSNAYNSAQRFNDLRDLHQHLSYLCTYAIDRFTTLKGKCSDSMTSLTTVHEEEIKKLVETDDVYTNVDDDVQVLETVTECIEIDSDDEIEPEIGSPAIGAEKEQSNPAIKQVESVAAINVQTTTNVANNAEKDELELPTPPVLSLDDGAYDHYDEKLRGMAVVVLEKDEQIERKLDELLQRQNSENGAGSSLSHDFLMQENDSITTHESAVLESETIAVHQTCNESDKNDDHDVDVEMQSNDEKKTDPVEGDHQAKVEQHIEDTKRDEFKQISHPDLHGDANVDRSVDHSKHESDVGSDNKMDAQNNDKGGACIHGSVSDSNLSGQQCTQLISNSDNDPLDKMVVSDDIFDDVTRNTTAGNIVTLSTVNPGADLV
ncbi:uncharacterized protein LOC119078984 [Bradysia coprophila]|uniref:uncharacterized protein LOC119078984 n=1 Tax=Bradysia coprophila TaxID=38358 RepID=UPI00187D9A0F|nr:uncharacterized protein LOC119078984 [Bradysia coprophila]